MANILQGIGMSQGGLQRASEGILNTALAIRQQQTDQERLGLERQEFARASEGHALDMESKRISNNINKIELSDMRQKQQAGERPLELESLAKAMNNPGQFEKDYQFLKANGRITTLSGGEGKDYEVILGKDAKWFAENIQNTLAYKQSFNTENLVRYTNEQNQLKQQITAITQEYIDKGKDPKEAAEDSRVKQLIPQLQRVTVGRTQAMLADTQTTKMVESMVSKGIPMEAIDKWAMTGDTSGLVAPTKEPKPEKLSDFERGYRQHIAIPGNENVTEAEYKTDVLRAPTGELSDDAVLKHFSELEYDTALGDRDDFAILKQKGFDKFDSLQKQGVPRREAFIQAKAWMLRDPDFNTEGAEKFDTLFIDESNDNMFPSHE